MLPCRVIALVSAVAFVGACSLPRLGRAPIVRFYGEATDPVGDTAWVRDPRVRRPADLVYAGVPGFGMGSEYAVSLEPQPVREVSVDRAVTDPDCRGIPCRFEPFEQGKVVTSADGMDAVVRRRAFSHFDGRANVRVLAVARLGGGRHTITSDHMPNSPPWFFEVR